MKNLLISLSPMEKEKKPFWETKKLHEMTTDEWEALCDGCALCCLHKFEDEDTLEIFYTGVSCKMLNIESCRCKAYKNRFNVVVDCIKIKPRNFNRMHMLPRTCAYRKIFEGQKLEPWHHLISGDKESVHEAGISVRGKAMPEENVHPDDITDFVLFKVE